MKIWLLKFFSDWNSWWKLSAFCFWAQKQRRAFLNCLLHSAFFLFAFLAKQAVTRQVSSMIHSARPTISSVVSIVFTWNLFCFARFWKVRTYGQSDNMFESNDHYRPWLWDGRVDQFSYFFFCHENENGGARKEKDSLLFFCLPSLLQKIFHLFFAKIDFFVFSFLSPFSGLEGCISC